ncbi:MAG: hypothetical protein QM753_01610 [Thermomicrobiales bacterium]
MCERAEAHADGTVTLHRIANRWDVQSDTLPVSIDFWIAIGFRDLPVDRPADITLLFILEDESVGVSMQKPDIVTATSDLNYLADASGFPIHRPGKYRFSVLSGSQEIGRYRFEVAWSGPEQDAEQRSRYTLEAGTQP